MAGRAAQRDPITLVEIRRMGMWVLFEFNGKASNGYEMKKALVKSKEEELEVTKPTKEEGNGATKMGRVEVTREHGEEVNDGEEGEEPHHSSWDPCNYAKSRDRENKPEAARVAVCNLILTQVKVRVRVRVRLLTKPNINETFVGIRDN
ncbi:hypothetical protein CFP56_039443 [Quercus suber]|uniref:Uncharacterized protein n=1 Tax=Quercus suber TaxID=58331 RepID=A0AAW0IZK6_QUESU